MLQEARITGWELQLEGIPVTLNPDSAAGWIIKQEGIDMVIVGADMIMAEGDAVKRIGTYSLSILAKEHKIPFYVAATTSTIYPDVRSDDVPVSIRDCRQITHVQGIQIAPYLESDQIKNYSQDVTPHENITEIITEIGIVSEPYRERIQKIIFSR